MSDAPRDVTPATTLTEAVAVLAGLGDEGAALAGGTWVMRRPVPYFELETRAWISTSMGRVPSMQAVTTEPAASAGRSARNICEGFATGASPELVISNTPTSFAAPKRFLVARTMR